MVRFHRILVNYYPIFVRNAPAEWMADGFYPGRLPVAVCLALGQNCHLDFNDAATREHFADIRRWEHTRFCTFALATDFGYGILYICFV